MTARPQPHPERPAEAVALYAAALAIASELSFAEHQVRAHIGLVDTHRTLGDNVTARRHYQQAVAVSTALGETVPEEVRAYLSAADTTDQAETRDVAGDVAPT